MDGQPWHDWLIPDVVIDRYSVMGLSRGTLHGTVRCQAGPAGDRCLRFLFLSLQLPVYPARDGGASRFRAGKQSSKKYNDTWWVSAEGAGPIVFIGSIIDYHLSDLL